MKSHESYLKQFWFHYLSLSSSGPSFLLAILLPKHPGGLNDSSGKFDMLFLLTVILILLDFCLSDLDDDGIELVWADAADLTRGLLVYGDLDTF